MAHGGVTARLSPLVDWGCTHPSRPHRRPGGRCAVGRLPRGTGVLTERKGWFRSLLQARSANPRAPAPALTVPHPAAMGPVLMSRVGWRMVMSASPVKISGAMCLLSALTPVVTHGVRL